MDCLIFVRDVASDGILQWTLIRDINVAESFEQNTQHEFEDVLKAECSLFFSMLLIFFDFEHGLRLVTVIRKKERYGDFFSLRDDD